MRLLGIDYGTKRVGIALTDEGGRMAFPHSVFPNDRNLINEIGRICQIGKVDKIILGQSLNYKMQPNEIMRQVDDLKNQLEKGLRIPVEYENEFLTSAQAARLQNSRKLDASAAALILQSYLDRSASAIIEAK